MLEFLQGNAIWFAYALFIVLMVRMHLGHGAQRAHGAGHAQPAQPAEAPESEASTKTGPETPGSRRATDGGHAHLTNMPGRMPPGRAWLLDRRKERRDEPGYG